MNKAEKLFEQYRLEHGMDEDDVKACAWYKDGLIEFAEWLLQKTEQPDSGKSKRLNLCPICDEEKELINNLYCKDCNNVISEGLGLT